MEAVERRLQAIRARIADACKRAGRHPETVRLIAVTKTRPLDEVRHLLELGVTDAAENRVQDARERIPQLALPGIAWHFIGRLQTNKAKYLPELVHWVHSVDRIEMADALQKACAAAGVRMHVLLQANTGGEEQKAGGGFAETLELLRAARECANLEIEGLMTMAPFHENPERTRSCFRQLREWNDQLAAEAGVPLPHLSMGMSNDFEIAIEEGATLVRVGTALFED